MYSATDIPKSATEVLGCFEISKETRRDPSSVIPFEQQSMNNKKATLLVGSFSRERTTWS